MSRCLSWQPSVPQPWFWRRASASATGGGRFEVWDSPMNTHRHIKRLRTRPQPNPQFCRGRMFGRIPANAATASSWVTETNTLERLPHGAHWSSNPSQVVGNYEWAFSVHVTLLKVWDLLLDCFHNGILVAATSYLQVPVYDNVFAAILLLLHGYSTNPNRTAAQHLLKWIYSVSNRWQVPPDRVKAAATAPKHEKKLFMAMRPVGYLCWMQTRVGPIGLFV